MKANCKMCKTEVEVIIERAGPHLKATCSICKKYIKFVSKKDIESKNLFEKIDMVNEIFSETEYFRLMNQEAERVMNKEGVVKIN